MAESGGDERIGRLKTEEEEDRLSALPDSLIHHILSFLPSTKQAIQTGILSKRWLNQWTHVSNLFFDFSGMFSDHCHENSPIITYAISRIGHQTLFLHQFPKLHKFHITTDRFYKHEYDPRSEHMIRFVVGKHVEELILKFFDRRHFRLPEFFFSQPCLVRLQLFRCYIRPKGTVNWKSLKDLSPQFCSCPHKVITRIVFSSPLLRSLVLNCRLDGMVKLIIASKSLKRLVVYRPGCPVDISCPNLREFDGRCGPFLPQNFGSWCDNFGWCDKVLEKFLSDSPILESLNLQYFEFSNARIASKSLKKFVFEGRISNEIAISCPHLEELSLSGVLETLRLMNLPSSVCAFLDLEYREGGKATVVKQILESVQHLNELKLGNHFLESLSALEMAVISNPLLKRKSLTLESSYAYSVVDNPGIAYALRCLPTLERLVVKLLPCELRMYVDPSNLDHSEENFWNSDGTHLSSLVPHLRAVEITGFSQRERNPKHVLDFVEFLLKNATVLEKMVIVLEDCETDFVIKVSQKLLSFPRCSAAIVELVCPK